MPIRDGENPNEKGGEVLIQELYKSKNKANTPIYIVGLTQYENVKHKFSAVWNVWKYDPANEDWKIKLRDLIFHISKVDSKIVKEKRETIFVEGTTDKEILTIAFDLFFPAYKSQIKIETLKFGAGSHWVERQLVIWAKTLLRKDENRYLQAVGLFDNDKPGKASLDALNEQIPKDSAESKTFSTITLERKYAKHLIPAFAKGLLLPLTLEELYAPFCWEHAKQQNWLVPRKLSEELLKDPQSWDKTNQSLKSYLQSLALSDEVILFLNFKINDDFKVQIVNFIKNLGNEEQKKALASSESLINDILVKLKLKN